MRNIWTIAKKEYDHYFITPIAYIVAFVILLLLGVLLWILIEGSISSFVYYGSAPVPDITRLSEWFVILLMIGCPILTMRLVADETKTGTIELLLTAPVRDYELVIGKWLGSFLFIVTIMVMTLIYPIILNRLVTPGIDWQLVLSSYLGVLLVAASFLALGVGTSALFSNQIAAYFIALLIGLGLLIFVGVPAQFLTAGGGLFEYLSMGTHFYNSFNTGRIQLSDLVYFISLISLGLFTGIVAVESRRWN